VKALRFQGGDADDFGRAGGSIPPLAKGRHGVGIDINALAAFVSNVKTTIYTYTESAELQPLYAGISARYRSK